MTTALPGWIATYFVRNGSKKFGPYHVRIWKERGKIHKQYIRAKDLAAVRAACEENRRRKQEGREISRNVNATAGNLNWLKRMCKRLDKGPIRDEDWQHMRNIKRHGFAIPSHPSLRRQPQAASRKPNKFMVPFFTKTQINRADKAVKQLANELAAKEPSKNKWKRWRAAKEIRPPAPKPRVPTLPETISEELVTTILANLTEIP